MRRLFPLALLLLASCASTPPPVTAPRPAPMPEARPQQGAILGLDQAELQARLGPPSFQLREGTGLKLQWQNANCVLDTYLYPPPGSAGAASVIHVDARRPGTGEAVAVEGCVAGLSRT